MIGFLKFLNTVMEHSELLHTAVQLQKEATDKNLPIRHKSVLFKMAERKQVHKLHKFTVRKGSKLQNGIFVSYTTYFTVVV